MEREKKLNKVKLLIIKLIFSKINDIIFFRKDIAF